MGASRAWYSVARLHMRGSPGQGRQDCAAQAGCRPATFSWFCTLRMHAPLVHVYDTLGTPNNNRFFILPLVCGMLLTWHRAHDNSSVSGSLRNPQSRSEQFSLTMHAQATFTVLHQAVFHCCPASASPPGRGRRTSFSACSRRFPPLIGGGRTCGVSGCAHQHVYFILRSYGQGRHRLYVLPLPPAHACTSRWSVRHPLPNLAVRLVT